MKTVLVRWDATKNVWILPDGTTTSSFDWEKFKSFGPDKPLEFITINQPAKAKKAVMDSTEYYERYYGRKSRPNKHDKADKVDKTNKVDRVLDRLVGAEKKISVKTTTPVKPVTVEPRRRVVIRKSSSAFDRI